MPATLSAIARETDETTARARARLVDAVRAAAASGMTQQQIAAATGRSQPEISRLLHFHGSSPLGRRVRKHRAELRRIVRSAGGSNLRIFGSVAVGTDGPDSDVDLVFTMKNPLSLLELGAVEEQLRQILDAAVDLVPDTALQPSMRERILSEAIPL